jgi:hypothetical protein
MIEQVSVFLENSRGRLAELSQTLGDAGIDMHALMIADTEQFGIVRIICDTPEKAKDLLDQKGFSASVTPVLAVEIPDRPGGLADVLEALGAAGINVEYAYCFVEPSGAAAVDIFKVDAPGADAVLESSGFRSLAPSELYSPDGSSNSSS